MKDGLIFAPVALQVTLTLWLYIVLAMAKSRATQRGEVNEERRALHDDAWPDSVRKINNNIRNQFELPVLFYVLIAAIYSTNAVNIFVHVAAWAFVISRLVHAVVHTGSNYVPTRRRVFMFGAIVLIGLLGALAYRLIAG